MEQQLPFGEWLRQRRVELDLTQWELARRVDCSRAAIQKIESGTRRPSKQMAELLAACLDIPPDDRAAFVGWARLGTFAPPSIPRDETHPPIHLPTPLTSLVGREPEIEAVRKYLEREDVRLLTLVGPPGVGKTRLSIAAASCLTPVFPDGVHFVPLENITDPALVPAAIADVLRVRAPVGQPVLEAVIAHLDSQTVLLVLDNFEQVLDAGLELLRLVSTCPELKVLVTSREGLHVQGEWRFVVQPLPLPDARSLSENKLEVLARIPALALFTLRAQAIQADFDLTSENALLVSQICTRLDGLPLAIELAATRVSSLSLGEILSGIGRLQVLGGNLRNLPARQRTVRAAIDWSYDLLPASERALFRRLGVFAGGCTLAAIEAVCQDADLRSRQPDADMSIVEWCQSLVERSLLRYQTAGRKMDGEGRYMMLEVVRECALEKLWASGEEQPVRHRHAEFYVALVEDTRSGLDGHQQGKLLQALEAENDNIRAVLGWSLQNAPETAEIALRLSGALGKFWDMRGYASEGRHWLEQALNAAANVPTTSPFVRIRALMAAGGLAHSQGDFLAARPLREQALSLAQAVSDKRVIATCLLNLATTSHYLEEYSKAATLYEQALTLFREVEDRMGVAVTLANMAWSARMQGHSARTRELIKEGLAMYRESGNQYGIAYALGYLGEIALDEQDYGQARALLEESLSIRREIGDEGGVAFCLERWAQLASAEHQYAQACEAYRDALLMYQKVGDRGGIASCLERLPELCLSQGKVVHGVHLWGAADALRQAGHASLAPVFRPRYAEAVARARKRLGEETFARAWAEGSKMTMEDAIAYTLAIIPHLATRTKMKGKKHKVGNNTGS